MRRIRTCDGADVDGPAPSDFVDDAHLGSEWVRWALRAADHHALRRRAPADVARRIAGAILDLELGRHPIRHPWYMRWPDRYGVSDRQERDARKLRVFRAVRDAVVATWLREMRAYGRHTTMGLLAHLRAPFPWAGIDDAHNIIDQLTQLGLVERVGDDPGVVHPLITERKKRRKPGVYVGKEAEPDDD